jgi:hydroxymethylpyrimidine/phosphomethylpyrimidine kinase
MAGYLALGCPVKEAFHKAKGFVDGAIRDAAVSRSGRRSVRVGR